MDLDSDKPADRRKPPFFCIIKKTTQIHLPVLAAYLGGKMSWDNSVLEAMSE